MGSSGHLSWEVMDAALYSIGHGVVICNTQGMISFANPAVERLFLSPPGGLAGKDLSTLFLPDDVQMLYPNLMHMGQTCQDFEGELLLKRVDGSSFFAYLTLRACPDDPETPEDEGLIILGIQDIDRKKRLEKILEKTHYDELVTIADSIAHELRNPLVGIGGFVKRMYEACPVGVDQEQYYRYILDDLKRIEDLVKSVRQLVNLPYPEYRLENLPDLVEHSLERLREECVQHRVRLTTQVEDITLRVDGGLIARAIAILAGNALEAIEQDGRIRVSAKSQNGVCRVVVEDDGPGISEADLPNIFAPFYTTKARGVGMDLALVRRIAELHGGSVEAYSKLGEGSRFELELPIERRRFIRTADLAANGQEQAGQAVSPE